MHMPMRSTAERIRQTLYFELGGIGLVTPLYMAFTGSSFSEGAVLLVAISVAVMIWSPLHNTVFDFIDLRLSGRVASDRPQVLRAVHAVYRVDWLVNTYGRDGARSFNGKYQLFWEQLNGVANPLAR